MLPDPDLSETVLEMLRAQKNDIPAFLRRFGEPLRAVLHVAAGRRSIPRSVRLAFP